MTKSENMVELTADDLATIKEARMGYGCLWLMSVPAFLFFMFVLVTISPHYIFSTETGMMLVLAVILVFILFSIYKFIKKNDRQIEKDIIGGQKKVITAPITNKRIKSSDITRGRQKGGISSKYFMTIAGRDYPMTEQKYLTIPVGEFMEIHLAPASKTVLKEKWLKQDGTIEEDKDEI